MKPTLLVGVATFLASMLGGCVVVPAEPVAFSPPPATVVVRPAHRHHHHHGHRPYWRRGWR